MRRSLLRRGGLVIALSARCVSSSSPTALAVTPSTVWYGDDGSWSAVSIRVGTPAQWVDVMVSTVSSETWLVSNDGCPTGSSDCQSVRGGVFNPENSTSWKAEGYFEFGVDLALGNTGYAEYGLDTIEFGTTGVSLTNAIIGTFNDTGTVNTTQNFLGFFGLGIVPGSFDNVVTLSAISDLVEKKGAIPSHSYGYTAGASYRLKGTPNSLTLGGYDANRFVPNDVSFALSAKQNPVVFIDSISATNANGTSTLLQLSDSVSATIDSSTPYLWLPAAVCDRFAAQLGLYYNDTLNLYAFANSTMYDALHTSSPTFLFALSDVSTDPNAVNITLPYDAFDLQLTFPAIPNTDSGDADATMQYFPLRQASSDDQYTIGRVFLQEAYIITDYERNNFSIHQAVHTASPLTNTSIISITQPSSSALSPVANSTGMKLSTPAIVGISIAAVILTSFVTIGIMYCRRRRRKGRNGEIVNDEKVKSPRFSILRRLRRRSMPQPHEASGDNSFPMEVGAGVEHERYELDAPLGPVELDSESGTLHGTLDGSSGTQDSTHLSAYERARRKLARQQIAAAQAQRQMDEYPVEKNEHDLDPSAYYRIPDIESPMVSPMGLSNGSLTMSHGPYSPVSPGFMSTPVSPLTAAPPPTYSRIYSTQNVVYAGRLPDNVQLPQIVPRVVGPDGRTIISEGSNSSGSVSTNPNNSASQNDSLGSHFTENEDLYGASIRAPTVPPVPVEESRRRNTQTLRSDNGVSLDGRSRRRLDGEDLVHIPQPAGNRFSWESGTEGGTHRTQDTGTI